MAGWHRSTPLIGGAAGHNLPHLSRPHEARGGQPSREGGRLLSPVDACLGGLRALASPPPRFSVDGRLVLVG